MTRRASIMFSVSVASLVLAHAMAAEPPSQKAERFLDAFALTDRHVWLQSLEGDWRVAGRMRFGADEAWDVFQADAKADSIMDGFFLKLTLQGEQTRTWPKLHRSERLLGFDPLQSKWQLAVIDNLGGQMRVAEGAPAASDPIFAVSADFALPGVNGENERIHWRAELQPESDTRFVWREWIRRPSEAEFLGIEEVFTRVAGPQSPLMGRWLGRDRRGNELVFEFMADGRALWVVATPDGRAEYAMRYAFDAASTPQRLDLDGITTGPLAFRTLYAIVEFLSDDSFRLDLEPGPPGSTGENIRPQAFDPEETVVFRRVASTKK